MENDQKVRARVRAEKNPIQVVLSGTWVLSSEL